MPFERPSLTELATRADADFDARLPKADSRQRRSVLGVLGRVHAGAVHGLYGFLADNALQGLPDTATGEVLLRWAATFGVEIKVAEPAAGLVNLTGSNGSEVDAGAVLQRLDGTEYVTTAGAVIADGVAQVPVEAVVAGAGGLAIAGVALTFASPVAGVSAAAFVAAAGLTGGVDAESPEAVRGRLLDRLRQPPHGGNAADYVRWAREVPGVTRAWVYPLMNGLGTVGVTFVMDGREDLIPEVGDVADVAAWIADRRPVTAEVEVFAPDPVPLDLTIDLTPDTPEGRLAVEAELRDLLARDAEPAGTILISRIREAVSIAAGESDNVVTSPTANVTHAAGELAVLGTITWS
ncbi:baseplate J/gp47 family protein [Brevundimonas vitis]|uniref:Baseplate J/gp47 family protein n=1 Tax=Brevundimonas vitisensis TaxID=2800818 RepID=A0ABX7BSE7_9CAUL|nr:baseplate J/gp47 family protein [Brevundimonas vitisensis]QQQ19663.1 baseplate J/gp47 family protein [Brevundimonas vitisensis]